MINKGHSYFHGKCHKSVTRYQDFNVWAVEVGKEQLKCMDASGEQQLNRGAAAIADGNREQHFEVDRGAAAEVDTIREQQL